MKTIVKIKYIDLNEEDSEIEVNNLIDKGWQPFGVPVLVDVASGYFTHRVGIIQTLVKYGDPKVLGDEK
jgi:hypothetical protein